VIGKTIQGVEIPLFMAASRGPNTIALVYTACSGDLGWIKMRQLNFVVFLQRRRHCSG